MRSISHFNSVTSLFLLVTFDVARVRALVCVCARRKCARFEKKEKTKEKEEGKEDKERKKKEGKKEKKSKHRIRRIHRGR